MIEWWNTANADGECPAEKWSLDFGYPTYLNSVMNDEDYQANSKVMSMTNKDTSAPADFIVDSSFAGIGAIISDVIPQMVQPVLFDGTAAEDVLENCQSIADGIVSGYNG